VINSRQYLSIIVIYLLPHKHYLTILIVQIIKPLENDLLCHRLNYTKSYKSYSRNTLGIIITRK